MAGTKVRVRLSHFCNAPEHPGVPGEVVSGVDETLAQAWQKNGGGKIVADDVPVTSDAKPAKQPAEPAAKKDK